MALYNPGPWGNATKHYQRPHVRVLEFPLEEGGVSPISIQYRVNKLIHDEDICDIDRYAMSINVDHTILYVEIVYRSKKENQEKELQFKLFSHEDLNGCIRQVNNFLDPAPFLFPVFGGFIPLKGKCLYGMFYTVDV